MTSEVRWNTISDCLGSYVKNWPTLVSVCEEYRSDTDIDTYMEIYNKVANISIKSISLDTMQSSKCKLAHYVLAWKKLEIELESVLSLNKVKFFQKRYDMAGNAFSSFRRIFANARNEIRIELQSA